MGPCWWDACMYWCNHMWLRTCTDVPILVWLWTCTDVSILVRCVHVCLAFCADLLTTASTERTFQTYISTNTWWAMWGCPCSLIDNIMHCNVVSNIHNYKEPISYARNSLQTCWQQQVLQRNIKHTYLQKHLMSCELSVDVYACEPQYYV